MHPGIGQVVCATGVLGLYAGGMTTRDISHHLSDLYDIDVGRGTSAG